MNAAILEARQRTVRIYAEARKGKTATQIATLCEFPLATVERALAPIVDARLSDPAILFSSGTVSEGLTSADVQVYWVGFLMAAGHIAGQGASSVLIVTLGDRSQLHANTFLQDLATPPARSEFCLNSLSGWQLYVRDPDLCNALLRWGVPSDLFGDDPSVLDDFPKALVAPFVRGYLDGNWATPRVRAPRSGRVLYGTKEILTAVNKMLKRAWGTGVGVLTSRPPRAELRFDPWAGKAVANRSLEYSARRRP